MALTCDSGMMLWGEIRCCQRVKLVLNCSPNVERKLFGITSYELLRKKLFCVLDHDYKLWCVLPPSECSFWATENLLQFNKNSGYKIVLSTLHKVKERQKILEQKNVSYPWDQVCWFVFDASCILPDQKCTTIYYFASSERLWKPGMDYFSYKTIWFDQLSW